MSLQLLTNNFDSKSESYKKGMSTGAHPFFALKRESQKINVEIVESAQKRHSNLKRFFADFARSFLAFLP